MTDPGADSEVSERITVPAYERDARFYRAVVRWLGLTIVISIVAVAMLVGIGKPIPDGLIAIGSAAVGAMAGVFK